MPNHRLIIINTKMFEICANKQRIMNCREQHITFLTSGVRLVAYSSGK